jgi:FAD/FMN-containing dehydrogenase
LTVEDFAARRTALQEAVARADARLPWRLAKPTSNLFRDREPVPHAPLDLGAFTHVLEVGDGWVETEGLVPYERLADATLAHGAMPCVVPQLKSITIGGAVAGIGIEASSFRWGLVHETVLELEILAGDGRVVIATPDNEHRDLFHAFPNSYGTLGYALRIRARTAPVRRFVHLQHARHEDPAGFFRDVAAACSSGADFVDGVVFGPASMVLTRARFVDDAPYASDYTYRDIYYRSLAARDEDYLSARDFLWRWDTDWFWCSRNIGAQNPLMRRLLGRQRLNSRFYTRVMRWNARLGLTRRLDRLAGRHPESVIQDVDIPMPHAAEFLDFLLAGIGILPIWVCPFRALDRTARWTLYPTDPDTLYVNFGFWDIVHAAAPHPPGHFNRLIERKVAALGGIKSLYSDSFYPRDEFDALFGGARYAALKARYDPQGRLPGLYEKCVQRR